MHRILEHLHLPAGTYQLMIINAMHTCHNYLATDLNASLDIHDIFGVLILYNANCSRWKTFAVFADKPPIAKVFQ